MTRIAVLCCLLAMAAAAIRPAAAQTLLLSETEISAALSHGPWPLPIAADPSNRVSGNADAVALGKRLFFSEDLSATGTISCATCHVPELGFTDGRARGQGTAVLDRNTQSLFNLRHQRWFGWDGANDNLWAQSIRPLLHRHEMGPPTGSLGRLLSGGDFGPAYSALFGPADRQDRNAMLVNVGKALAAYVETLETGSTPFDAFRDALARGDRSAAARYPPAAQRGFRIFAGRGKCNFCHVGPLFSNGEFHDAGVPYFIEPGRVDRGRIGGIEALKDSPFTLDGAHTDDREKSGAWAVRQVAHNHAHFGAFRVPSLRNLEQTAPYMHNGSLATLEDVVDHYSNIDLERLHADGERILEPLGLSGGESADLVAFLRSLSRPADAATPPLR